MLPPEGQSTAHVHALFVQNLMPLRGYVVALLPDFSRVDDVVQETFLTVTAKAADFQPGTNFKAWLFAIARRKVLEALRDPACGRVAFTAEVIEALSAEEDDQPWLEEHLQALRACLDRLAPQARRAIDLRYQQAHRPPEIARLMGWSLNAVNVALARARVALRGCVESNLKHPAA
jgi:RNA polymerase sigma-70 factor (ECF subfamily)